MAPTDDGVDSSLIEYQLRYALSSASAQIKGSKGLASHAAIADFGRKWQVSLVVLGRDLHALTAGETGVGLFCRQS